MEPIQVTFDVSSLLPQILLAGGGLLLLLLSLLPKSERLELPVALGTLVTTMIVYASRWGETRELLGGSRALDGFDRDIIDATVNSIGTRMQRAGQIARLFQTGYVRNYALSFLLGVVFILWYLMVR